MDDTRELKDIYRSFLDVLNQYIAKMDEYEEKTLEYNALVDQENEIRGKIPGIIWVCVVIGGVIGTVGLIIVGTIIGLLIGYAIGCLLAVITKTDHKFEKLADEFHKTTVGPAEHTLNNLEREMQQLLHSDEMKELNERVPEDYRNIGALEFFVRMLSNRQADTEKECFNLYMEYMQRENMINLQNQQVSLSQDALATQQQQLAATQQVNQSLGSISENQTKMSKQMKYGNVVSTLNYMNTRQLRKTVKK